jgi:hypothetical protein
MRNPVAVSIAVAIMAASELVSTGSSPVASSEFSQVLAQVAKDAKGARRTHSVHFPDVTAPSDAGIGLVRIVLTCARVAAITRIPDDWYVQTLRPNIQSGPEWKDFQFASNAVEFAAGHGVSRLPRLRLLDGALRIEVEDDRCFDISADIGDEIGTDWKVRLPRARLQLRQ